VNTAHSCETHEKQVITGMFYTTELVVSNSKLVSEIIKPELILITSIMEVKNSSD
jgi:hypothetical protein